MSDCKHKLVFGSFFDQHQGELITVYCEDCPEAFAYKDLDDYMIVRKPEKYEEYNFDQMMGIDSASLDFFNVVKKGDEE